MATLNITRMGNPVLRAENQQVSLQEIKSPEFIKLLEDMKDTMAALSGIGIAAPQVGVNKQVCLIELDEDNERYEINEELGLMTIINPKITILDDTLQGFWEGCLSLPGLRGYVERPRKVKIDYLDAQGEEKTIEVEGFLATVFQHELDHLFGVLYVDRISDTRLLSYEEEFDRFVVEDTNDEDENVEDSSEEKSK